MGTGGVSTHTSLTERSSDQAEAGSFPRHRPLALGFALGFANPTFLLTSRGPLRPCGALWDLRWPTHLPTTYLPTCPPQQLLASLLSALPRQPTHNAFLFPFVARLDLRLIATPGPCALFVHQQPLASQSSTATTPAHAHASFCYLAAPPDT